MRHPGISLIVGVCAVARVASGSDNGARGGPDSRALATNRWTRVASTRLSGEERCAGVFDCSQPVYVPDRGQVLQWGSFQYGGGWEESAPTRKGARPTKRYLRS
jgi:hypothetical protein